MADNGRSRPLTRTIPSRIDAGHELIETILDQLSEHAWTGRDFFGVRLALEEGVINAIKHGNQLAVDKRVVVEWTVSPQRLWIRIEDEGPGFDPSNVPDCTDCEHIDLPSGRGIMLMRNFMTRVEYRERGNVLEMEKQRSED